MVKGGGGVSKWPKKGETEEELQDLLWVVERRAASLRVEGGNLLGLNCDQRDTNQSM